TKALGIMAEKLNPALRDRPIICTAELLRYQFITLYLSYAPPEDLPLAGKSSGTAFFTVITVVGGGTIAFTKAAIMLRLKPYNEEGVLKHAGVCMQIGSLIGAVVCALTANLCKPPDYLTS
ncbi:hypothetical protein FOZ63_014463, partial [Perkinsus olseni]